MGELPSRRQRAASVGAKAWAMGSVLLLMMGYARPCAAYCRTTVEQRLQPQSERSECDPEGTPLHWNNGCIPFGIHLEGSELSGLSFKEVHAAFERAFQTWASADCGDGHPALKLLDRGKLECGELEYLPEGGNTNNNIVIARSEEWPYEGVDALTQLETISFVFATGEIVDADVELNAADYEFSVTAEPGTLDLETAFVHSIGHALGLAHSEATGSVMNKVLESDVGLQRRGLGEDDINAVCDLFPPDEAFECPAEEVGRDFIRECAAPGKLQGNCQNSLVPAPSSGPRWIGTTIALMLVALGSTRIARRGAA